MIKGYHGKLLEVNLTEHSCQEKEIPEEIFNKYIGGSGLGAYYLTKYVDPECDPLGPDNALLFFAGPFTDTKVPTSGRHQIISKSPLTGIYGEGDAGGTFGVNLKRTGYDGIIITGKSEIPVYLWVTDEKVEIRDASKYWGLDTYEIGPVIKKETDSQAVMATIGPAGENLVKLAGIFHDNEDARPVARTGLGAVMGAKKLKALVVHGGEKADLFSREELENSLKKWRKIVVENTQAFGKYGTAVGMKNIEEIGDLPVKNWSQGSFKEGVEKINGVTLTENYVTSRYYCNSCIIGCGRTVGVKYGEDKGEGAGPEYETLASLGSMNLIDDPEALIKGNELCNRYGIDTISTGSVISFAIEAFKNNYIDEKDTGGLILDWNSPDTLLKLIKKIAFREDIGDLLAEGVRKASSQLEGETDNFANHVKGLELPAHDPRAFNSLAVGYATSNRGACHLQGFSHVVEKNLTLPDLGYEETPDRFAVKGKGKLTKDMQDLMCIFDSLKMCKFFLFGGVPLSVINEWYNYVTGNKIELKDLLLAGERIFNLKRIFNNRCGITSKDDNLPERILKLKRKTGGAAENLPPLAEMLEEYYQEREWKDGVPTKDKLHQLGLNDI